MTHDNEQEQSTPPRRPYEPPTVVPVVVDPARDMLLQCNPGKVSRGQSLQCRSSQFS